jgi:DNA-binding response OmpR family regulator
MRCSTALDIIRTVGPDVVVLDLEMPLLNGAEPVRIVVRHVCFACWTFASLGGHGERWRVVEGARLGVNEYLIRPAKRFMTVWLRSPCSHADRAAGRLSWSGTT